MAQFNSLITLTQVSNGAPGNSGAGYYISSNQEEVARFSVIDNGEKKIETYPSEISFMVYNLPKEEQESPLELQKEGVNLFKIELFNKDNGELELYDKNNELRSLSEFYEFPSSENTSGIIQLDYSVLLFKIQELFDILQDDSPLLTEAAIIRFAYLDNSNNELAIKVISLRDGVHSEMAQFNIEATKINAAINNSKMEFDETGLSLYLEKDGGVNQGLKIYQKNGEEKIKVFWADENGNLHMTGEITATSGSFTGSIHATTAEFDDGTIGGFTISKTELTSSTGGIILDGTNNTIKAENIEIGTGAIITDYIQLGNAFIRNPNENNGVFLETNYSADENSKKIIFKDDGTAWFGNIQINGPSSTITANSWSLTPDIATFNNIVASGSIETAVFKTGSTQAVGGSMIFKPSYKIKEVFSGFQAGEDKIIELSEAQHSINVGNVVWIMKENECIETTIKAINGSKITLNDQTPFKDFANYNLLDMGSSNYKIISINSGSSNIGPSTNRIIPGEGFSISESNSQLDNENKIKLFIGNLEKIKKSGYGLYSDNVYLKGSLTTIVGNNSFAGVNTLGGVYATAFSDNYTGRQIPTGTDESKIVFWAGAEEDSSKSIQDAYFQVTEQGSIFASRAKLTNSLLVGGTIRGTDIYAARIHGEGAGLEIYDTSKGISFKKDYNLNTKTGTETFAINETGLKTDAGNFILINNNEVTFSGKEIKTNNLNNYLSLTTRNNIPVLFHQQGNQYCGFYFEDGNTSFKIKDMEKLKLSSGLVEIHGDLNFNSNVENNPHNMQYKAVTGGYDLFII